MIASFSSLFAAEFSKAVDAAGMRVDATVRPKDCVERPFSLRVAFDRPDVILDVGAKSTDYVIEYLTADAPTLTEGDEVEIADVVYRVREEPRVPEVGGRDGTFSRATLTRVSTCAD